MFVEKAYVYIGILDLNDTWNLCICYFVTLNYAKLIIIPNVWLLSLSRTMCYGLYGWYCNPPVVAVGPNGPAFRGGMEDLFLFSSGGLENPYFW